MRGVRGTLGILAVGKGNPLQGARVKRLVLTPTGSTKCEMLETRGAWNTGDVVLVGPGMFHAGNVHAGMEATADK